MQLRRPQMSVLTVIAIIVIVFSRVHLGIGAQIHCNVTRDGGNADLMCKVPSDMDIVQVTWQKRTGNSYETLVTHSKRFSVKISKPYENRVSVVQSEDPGTSAIALSQLEKEDDACFTAIFNIFPEGALKGEVCLPKLREVREVICKSPAEFSVTLDPPQIKTQHTESNGNIIQKGRWLNGDVSPVCIFQQHKKARTRRNVQDGNEIFTIECKASGTERPTITWIKEGQPISKEEKMNITRDLITVISTRHHSWSTLPEEETIRCNISYDKGSHHENNAELIIIRIIISSILAVLLCVVICVMCCILKRKKPYTLKKEDEANEGSSTPFKHHTSNNTETPGNKIKQRNGSTVKKNKENNQRNNSESLIYTDEVGNRIPGSETKQRNSSIQKKKHKSAKRLFD